MVSFVFELLLHSRLAPPILLSLSLNVFSQQSLFSILMLLPRMVCFTVSAGGSLGATSHGRFPDELPARHRHVSAPTISTMRAAQS